MIKAVVAFASLAAFSNAECPNACNGHGKCTSYDMCICNRNWQANDCSERVCQFGLAHVDTPKGDLDMNNEISGPDEIVALNHFTFPYGTTEQFPQGFDTDLREVKNSAHYYMECSNKGKCNRETGECECFDGYDGAACQRASCPGFPNSCSGHGVCKDIRQLAEADHNNVYELWDKHSTMGCECDEGFSGPDCSIRKCKFGIDPLYYDDSSTIKYATWDFAIVTDSPTADFTDGMPEAGPATFAIRFFDMHGEDWVTEPITYGATCDTVIAALEALPNKVIPKDTLECEDTVVSSALDPLTNNAWWASEFNGRDITYRMAFWEYNIRGSKTKYANSNYAIAGTVYRIKFGGNPGKLRQPEIETHLDGKRASIQSEGDLVTKVWTDGQQGESKDYFADHCDGVTVNIGTSSGVSVLTGLTTTETQLLKACLGGANFDVADNVEIYDWDYGNDDYPHLIKLVLTTATADDGGYYAAVQYSAGTFWLMNKFVVPDGTATDNFDVYTTKGVLARTSSFAKAKFGFASNEIYTVYNASATSSGTVADWYSKENFLRGDVACEINDNNGVKRKFWTRNTPDSQTTCVNKTDIITLLSTDKTTPYPYINLYSVVKIHQSPFLARNLRFPSYNNFNGTYVIETDISTNYAALEVDDFYVYKFFPSTESTYTYVEQCSNRGICNTESGICECFGGYTGDDCSSQNTLSV